MKRIFLILLLFGLSNIFAQTQPKGPLEGNPVYAEVTVLSGTDYVDIDLRTLVPQRGYDLPKLIGFFTDAALTSATLTIEVYDPINEVWKTLEEPDGTEYTYTIDASKYYTVNTSYFAGLLKFRFKMSAAEGADRSFVLSCRVY